MAVDLGIPVDRARIRAMRELGLWGDRLITDCLADVVKSTPDKIAIIERRSQASHPRRFTYADLDRASTRIALGLAAEGVTTGDVVAMQLPNWFEAAAIAFGCWKIGAIVNPLMPIFRRRELAYMLAFAETKTLIVAKSFRGFDHAELALELQSELPALDNVHIVGGDFDQAFLNRAWESEADPAAIFHACRPGADAAAELIYTSGTTGEPKGVLHSANTLMASMPAFTERGVGAEDMLFMASPIAHQTGFLVGIVLPVTLGVAVVFQDVWDADAALSTIAEEGCSFTMASTPFLADLVTAAKNRPGALSSLKRFVCAGAPVPRVLTEEAARTIGCEVLSGWGMSENGLASATYPGDPPAKTFATDGRASPGLEIAVVADTGVRATAGEEGDLKSRGASCFLGYMRRPELAEIDDDGWFASGDRATMDDDGYIRIVGRAKDIVIRGGENIPIVEVEELLYRMPEVVAAAIVAMPDSRLGERACAFVEGLRFRRHDGAPAGDRYVEDLPAGAVGARRSDAPHALRQDPEIHIARTRAGPEADARLTSLSAGTKVVNAVDIMAGSAERHRISSHNRR